MISNSPESPSKKRKQPINGLKRDQPLFTGRRPYRTLQQPPEFFTDSLNTSYIPSPSPPKSPTHHAVRAKPRQTLGDGRSLAAAFRPTSRVKDGNRPPSSSSSSDRKRTQETLKPRPRQTDPGAKRPTPSKSVQSPVHNRTPTPPRGRQASITSLTSPVNSESSPGRGYAEAYQRIVEEENLAHEESLEDMEEIEGFDFSKRDRSQNLDQYRLRRLQNSTSPMSLKASRRASSRGTVNDSRPVRNGKEDMAHDSGSESGVDHTENITDTSMDSGSSQYAKDLQRLGALKNGAKAFSKARVGEKVGLTAENLRRNGSNESLGSSFSGGSLSNRGSDPSINIPKAWGRKAKPGKDWLARINSRSGRFTGDVPKRHSSGEQMIAENQRREWSEPIDQWIATAADVPLPSSEDRLSGIDESPQGSTPTTAVPDRGSFDRRRQWEVMDDEFTGRSLQISESPPIRIRTSALDRMRDREIKNLEKRAVTTSRLGALGEKSSRESLRRITSTKSIGDIQQDDQGSSQRSAPYRRPSVPSDHEAESKVIRQDETPEDSLHDEGEPVPDTPVVIYRNHSHGQVASDKKSGKEPEDARQTAGRPRHERKDSHDLLKRLSRVTSESPSPTREHAEVTQEAEQAPEPAEAYPSLKTPVVTGAWVDQTLENTPAPAVSKSSLKTPLITGAWIDTPLPTGGRGPPMPTPSDQEEHKELNAGKVGAADLIHRLSPNTINPRPKLQSQSPLKYSGPPLAKSALDEIINDARSKNGGKQQATKQPRNTEDSEDNPTLNLGESTIQSLEELIANNTEEDFSTLLAPTTPSPETSNPTSSDPSPASQALTTITTTSDTTTRSSRLPDLQSYTHLLTRLTNLAPSLRASKKRIQTLERAVSTVPASQTQLQLQDQHPNSELDECNEAGSLHDFLFPCRHCGCPGGRPSPLPQNHPPSLLPTLTTPTLTLTLPLPPLLHYPTPHHRLPRPTRLGLLIILAYCAYLLESYARFKYCHPLYATSMDGWGSGRGKPEPPFVALKVLGMWFGWGGEAPFWNIVRALLRLVGRVVGGFVGFVVGDGGGGGGGGSSAARLRATGMPRSTVGEGGGVGWMRDDEFL